MDTPNHEKQLHLATDVAIRLGALSLLIAWCAVILAPFLLPIAWGAILAVALYAPFMLLNARLGGRSTLSATIMVLAMLGAIILPAVLLGSSLVDEVQVLYNTYQQGRLTVPEPSAKVLEWPLIGDELHAFWLLASQNLDAALGKLQPYMKGVFGWLLAAGASFGMGVLEAIFAIIISGAMLATAAQGAANARAFATRLAGERGSQFVELATAAVRGVTRGILGVALIQSLLGGLGLLVAGVPAAGLLTVVMLVLSVIQVGIALVMIPAAIWLFANAAMPVAIAFTVWTVMLLPLDNVLKPLLMGRGLKVPVLVIFLGAIGGFLTQGIIGLFVGAVVLVVGYELLKQWLTLAPESDAAAASSDP